MGYAVVDATTVMVTYLSHVIQSYAHEVPSRKEVQQLLDILGRKIQKRVAGRVSETSMLGTLLKVLRNIFGEEHPATRHAYDCGEIGSGGRGESRPRRSHGRGTRRPGLIDCAKYQWFTTQDSVDHHRSVLGTVIAIHPTCPRDGRHDDGTGAGRTVASFDCDKC